MQRVWWAVGFALCACVRGAAAQVSIETDPPGAEVRVKGRAALLGVTPLADARVPRGRQVLLLSLAGHRTAEVEVKVDGVHPVVLTERLNPLSNLVLEGDDASTTGAQVQLDGQPMGPMPLRRALDPGRHIVIVSREGYVVWRQWVMLEPLGTGRFVVKLAREVPDAGSILVLSDLEGATVFVDGVSVGLTPTVQDKVSPGSHRVEIHAEGRVRFSANVQVSPGERVSVNPRLQGQGPEPGGPLLVEADRPDVLVLVDGVVRGRAPITVEDLDVGIHVVEGLSPDALAAQEAVRVEPGASLSVRLKFDGVVPRAGTLSVATDVEGATVQVDGLVLGRAPLVDVALPSGPHTVQVEALGFEPQRDVCTVSPVRACSLTISLKHPWVRVRLDADVPRATVRLNGGPPLGLPYAGELRVGTYRAEVTAEGYAPHRRELEVTPSGDADFFFHVADDPAARFQLAAVDGVSGRRYAFAAAPIAKGLQAIDVSLGLPVLAEIRWSRGMTRLFGFGFSVSSFGRLTGGELRFQVGGALLPWLDAGVVLAPDVAFGPRNVWAAGGRGAVSLSARPWSRLSLTASTGLQAHRDHYGFTARDASIPVSGDAHQTTLQMSVAAVVEVAVGRRWNLFASGELRRPVEGGVRRVYGDAFGMGAEPAFVRLGFGRLSD